VSTPPLASGEKSLADIFTDTSVWEELRQIMVPIVQPIFTEAYMLGAELGANAVAPRGEVDPSTVEQFGFRALNFDPRRIASVASMFIGTYTDNWWRQFSVATQNGIRRAILRAETDGTGTAGVLRAITPLFGAERAQLIAVSETTNLMGGGAIETYRQAGYQFWEWRTSRDSHVDGTCRNRDKKKYPITLQFQRAHPGCRCWPVPAGQPIASSTPLLPVQPSGSFPFPLTGGSTDLFEQNVIATIPD